MKELLLGAGVAALASTVCIALGLSDLPVGFPAFAAVLAFLVVVGLLRRAKELRSQVVRRTEAEKALQTSESLYQELFEHANDMVYTHDVDGRFTSLNRSGEKLTGYPELEALKTDIASLIAPGLPSASTQSH